MSRVLITGMSGTGKSSVLAVLADRGIAVVDLDDDEWSHEVPRADGPGVEQLWRSPAVARLLADGPEVLVLAGCASNQGEFYDRFDDVVLLSAPLEVLRARIAERTTNDFGKRPEDLRRIVDDVANVEPLLRSSSTIEVDATQSLSVVVDVVERLAKGQ